MEMENKGVQISAFDYSVESFLSPISGENSSIDEVELESLSSMTTFLREWKHFKYEPRNLSLFHQSKDFDADYHFELPHFSSATVPQAEQLVGEAKNQSSDFVLYAGGNIWALDWCPRLENKPDSSISCEYLAVSAHPPGSNYHKMGAPLNGRGAIQIWSIITKTEKLELGSKPKHIAKRGRPKKDLTVKNPHDSDKNNNKVKGLTSSKPKGRPKKLSICADSDRARNELKTSKKRGRPRKTPLDEDFSINMPKKKERSEKCAPISVEIPLSVDSSETLLALPPPPKAKFKKSTKEGTKMENSRSNEKRPMRQVKSIYLRNRDEDLITSSEVENYKKTPPPIIEPLDSALPLSFLYSKRPSKRKSLKEKPRRNQDSSPVSCLTTVSSVTDNSSSVECEIDNLAGGPGPCEKEDLAGGPGPCEKEELTSQESLKEMELPMPSLAFCLAHNGKVAWDIKWKPITENNIVNNTKHMGYLAVLLGNGSLEVWDVPFPSMVQKLYSCNNRIEGTDPRFIKLKPVFRCSKLKCGERQSIPLTLQWSTSPPNDLILAGCHDGTVALWKFSVEVPSRDSKPLLFFTADSVPIRSLCWAPHESDDAESSSILVTAGSEGLKFWDIRNPYRPLWELVPPHKSVMSVDWLTNPRCVLMSLDDGTVKFVSIPKAANDSPVTGNSFNGRKHEGLFSYTLSLFNIWSIHVSRDLGYVAFCDADGSAVCFKLNERFLEKEPGRNRVPYFLCGSFQEDKRVIKISISDQNNSLIENLPLKSIKGPNRYKGDEKALVKGHLEDKKCESFPSKLVAVHKVKWNMNKGCERWLCYGGAAGIIRVQKISFPSY